MPENFHLLSTGQVSLGLSQCGATPTNRTEEEIETHFTLVFPLSGVFAVSTEGTRNSATPAKAVLFSKGQARRIRHPFGGHDTSVYISMKARLAEPFLDRSGRFRVDAGKTTPRLDYWLRSLIASAKTGYLNALELEEFTVSALTDLMEVRDAPAIRNRRDIVLDAEEYLSLHFREQCDLSTVARQVGYSRHHLSRSFKQITGESLSRRRMRLRLSAALSEILGGGDDLSSVAVESGFYDQSHMTNSFRSHFGLTPQEARKAAAKNRTATVGWSITSAGQAKPSSPTSGW